MKNTTRILLAAALVLFGTSAWPFADGFEANALEPADITAISIDKAMPVPVTSVAVDRNGLLTASTVKPPVPPEPVCRPTPAGFKVVEKPWATLKCANYRQAMREVIHANLDELRGKTDRVLEHIGELCEVLVTGEPPELTA